MTMNIRHYTKAIVAAIPAVVWAGIVVWRIFDPDAAPGVTPESLTTWAEQAQGIITAAAAIITPILVYALPNAGFVKTGR